MTTALPKEIAALSVAEKLHLVEDLWDDIAASGGEFPVNEAQTSELRARVDDLAKNPGSYRSWASLRSRFLSGE